VSPKGTAWNTAPPFATHQILSRNEVLADERKTFTGTTHFLPQKFLRQATARALQESDGSKAEAARRLGVQRRLLYEKIRKLGLERADQPLEDENLNSSEDPLTSPALELTIPERRTPLRFGSVHGCGGRI
jgi:hypothetical protein